MLNLQEIKNLKPNETVTIESRYSKFGPVEETHEVVILEVDSDSITFIHSEDKDEENFLDYAESLQFEWIQEDGEFVDSYENFSK